MSYNYKVFLLSILFCLLFMVFLPLKVYASYSPSQIKAAYNLPSAGGSGTVAIVLWENSPTVESDLRIFSNQFNLPDCTQSNGCLTIHYMGGNPIPPSASNTVIETNMDTQWVHAIAPNAKLLLVEADSATNQDIFNAISYASQQPGVVAVSMSFGNPNSDGTIPCNVFSNSSISYFAASGDWGTDVMWPAVCPQVIAVGGTTLITNGSSASETAWSGSGGGLSHRIAEPSYQSSFNIPGANGFRGVPDVAAVADPHTGATVVVQGNPISVAGTSLAAPIWAGISSLNGIPITHEALYSNAAASTYLRYYRDITSGSNGSCGSYCTATTGYDYVTGLGSPIDLPGGSGSGGGNGGSIIPTATPTPTSVPGSGGGTNPISHKIFGVVFSDLNNNGTKDPGEPGLSGVSIALSGAATKNTTTDASGNYSFPNVSTGNYTVTLSYSGQTSNVSVSITDNTSDAEVDFRMVGSGPNPTIAPITPTPTPTPTPDLSGGGGGGGGVPTPTPEQTYTCNPCSSSTVKPGTINIGQLCCVPN